MMKHYYFFNFKALLFRMVSNCVHHTVSVPHSLFWKAFQTEMKELNKQKFSFASTFLWDLKCLKLQNHMKFHPPSVTWDICVCLPDKSLRVNTFMMLLVLSERVLSCNGNVKSLKTQPLQGWIMQLLFFKYRISDWNLQFCLRLPTQKKSLPRMGCTMIVHI